MRRVRLHSKALATAFWCGIVPGLFSCSSQNPDLVFLDARHQSASLRLKAGENGDDYWIIPYSSFATTRGSGSFRASERNLDPLRSAVLQRAAAENQQHKNLRDSLVRLRAQSLRNGFRSMYRALGEKNPETLSIHSPFSSDGAITIQGTLKASDQNANLYVDKRFENDLTSVQAQAIVHRISTISLPRLKTLFGDPTDIDRNGRIDLFFSSTEKIGSGVVGFFRPSDLLPNQPAGNEREIVYVQLPDPDLPSEFYDATVAHELLHLIHFGQKTLRRLEESNGQTYLEEDVFLSEGLAHLAEELTGFGLCSVIIAKNYLDCIDRTSIASSGVRDSSLCSTVFEDDSLARRGGAMLLLLRVLQNQGGLNYSDTNPGTVEGSGRTFLRDLIRSDQTGLVNLEAATGKEFHEIYGDFLVTLALDGTSHPLADRYSFTPEVLDPFTRLPRGLGVRMTRVDPSMITFHLNGPMLSEGLFEKTDALIRSGARFYTIHLEPNASKTIAFRDDSGLGLGVAIVRK